MPAVPIIVWCHPRSCSTAFERSFLQREDTKVWHEPFSDPFYFGKERACQRYAEAECQEKEGYHSTIESVAKQLLESAKDPAYKYIFIKFIFPAATLHQLHPESRLFPATATESAAASPLENPTVLSISLLRRFKHTFLIRTPERSVPSYYKCVQDQAAGFSFFEPAETGIVELRMLYDWLSNPASTFHTAPDDGKWAEWPVVDAALPPPIVDASLLLAHPGYVMSQYCEALQVPFSPNMLSWDAGTVEIWAKWGSYHAAAEQSSGFQETKPSKPLDDQPEEVQACVKKTLPDYEYLFERRTIRAPQTQS